MSEDICCEKWADASWEATCHLFIHIHVFNIFLTYNFSTMVLQTITVRVAETMILYITVILSSSYSPYAESLRHEVNVTIPIDWPPIDCWYHFADLMLPNKWQPIEVQQSLSIIRFNCCFKISYTSRQAVHQTPARFATRCVMRL